MLKITFLGAGSTVFARNVLGDCMCSPILRECEIALYDINAERLNDSHMMLNAINKRKVNFRYQRYHCYFAYTPYHGNLCTCHRRDLP